MKKRTGYRIAAAAVASATLLCGAQSAGAAQTDASDDSQGVTAQVFSLVGQSTANNIKVNWSASMDTTYTIERAEQDGGNLGAFATVGTGIQGSSWDDYDVSLDANYVYRVTSSSGDAGDSNAVKTFTVPDGLQTYDNTKASTFHGESGFNKDGMWYRYGSVADDGNVDIVEYTSSDDVTWSDPRVVISHDSVDWLQSAKLESFNAQYNTTTGKVVIWAHWENDKDYTEAKVFQASGTPGANDFTSTKPLRPQNKDSRDLSMYVDDDGGAYLISSTNTNSDQIVYSLSKDWTAVSDDPGIVVNEGQRREAPSLVHKDGYYYLFTSGTNGWYPTQGQVLSATSIKGLADAQPQLVGNSQTYGAQSGGVADIGDNVMIAANRWSGGWAKPDPALNGAWSSQRMLPVAFNNGFASYNYYAQVKYDAATGVVVPVQSGRNLTAGASIFSDGTTAAAANTDNGWTGDAAYAIDGLDDTDARQYIPSGNGAYTWTTDLGKLSTISQVDITFHEVNGSDTYAQYQIKGSADGVTFTPIADKSNNVIPGFNESLVDSQGEYRYLQISVSATKRVKDDASAETWWQRG